jgi:hypothetical protein
MANRSCFCLAALALATSTAGCANRRLDAADNPDVAMKYRDKNKYNSEIETGTYRDETADQGKGIHPKTLRAIEDQITNVYEKDFERCLEEQMDVQETRFMRSMFSVEFTIDTTGKASAAKVLDIWVKKQNAKGSNIGDVPADGMKACIGTAIDDWVFDPPPEVVYVHTYRGQVGEAF